MTSASRRAVGGCLVALLLPAAATASTGGESAPDPPKSERPSPASPTEDDTLAPSRDDAGATGAVALTTRTSAFVGVPLNLRGKARGGSGQSVRVERRLPKGGWRRVVTVRVGRDGSFATSLRPGTTGRVVLRAVLVGSESGPEGHASSASASRTVTIYQPAMASWYGPGLYGNRLACGGRLSPVTIGVAHRSLRCGTRVALIFGGRSVVASVIDRGPYIAGREWDLTAATARRLGLVGVRRIGAAPLGRIGVVALGRGRAVKKPRLGREGS